MDVDVVVAVAVGRWRERSETRQQRYFYICLRATEDIGFWQVVEGY